MACPTITELSDVVAGIAVAETMTRVRAHIKECPDCKAVSESLAHATHSSGAGETHPLPSGSTERELIPGAEFGRYRISHVVGRGTTGTVYLATDGSLDRQVALKVLNRDHHTPERTTREARALAKLRAPHVVTLYEIGEHEGVRFMAMEFADHGTLRAWLDQTRRPWRSALARLLDAGRGLVAAHRAGFIHRDFKPENVLVFRDDTVKVSDFGLVTLDGSTETNPSGEEPLHVALTQTGALVGTPRYMSPEQLRGESASALSDQFSFCVTLYEALTGRRPFIAADAPGLLREIEHGTKGHERPPQVPARVWRAMLKGLSTNPSERYPNMQALLDALERGATNRLRDPKWLVGGMISASVIVIGASAFLRQAPCTGLPERWDSIWSDDRRATVAHALRVTGAFRVDEITSIVDRALTRAKDDWVSARRELCEQQRESPATAPTLEARLSCMEDRLDEARALVAVLNRADAAIALKATDAVGALRRASDCARVTADEALSMDPPQRAQHDEVRRTLASVKALTDLARYSEAATLAQTAIAPAKELGSKRLTALSLFRLGEAQDGQGDPAGATTLTDAAYVADSSPQDEVAVLAWAKLATITGYRTNKPDVGNECLRRARAALGRLGNRPELEGRILRIEGALLALTGRTTQALEVLDRAVLRFTQSADVPLLELALAQQYRGNTLIMMNRPKEAAAALVESLAIREKVLGPSNVLNVFSQIDLWTISADAGRYADGLKVHVDALHTLEGALGPAHLDLRRALERIVIELTELGRGEEALVYADRSIALQENRLGTTHPALLIARAEKAAALLSVGRAKEALAIIDSIQAAFDADPATPPHHRALLLTQRAETLLTLGKNALALEASLAAYAIRKKDPHVSPDMAATAYWVGRSLHALKRDAEAIGYFEQALEVGQSHATDRSSVGQSRVALAEAVLGTHQNTERAKTLLVEAEKDFAASDRVTREGRLREQLLASLNRD